MRIRLILSVAAMLAASACGGPSGEQQAQAPAAASAPEPEQVNPPAEDLDPFIVMIDAERWGVIIDRAMEGAIIAPSAPGDDDTSEMLRADAALKRGAAKVIELRNRVCEKGLVTGAACTLPDWPVWTREPPTGDTPIDEIVRRSAWLSEVMGPYTSAACDAGRQASGDDLFCSVE